MLQWEGSATPLSSPLGLYHRSAVSLITSRAQVGSFRGLGAEPCGDLTFIVGENGRPLTKESFGNLFRDACKAAGVPGSAHGVRKLAATRMADNGGTEAQLMAVFGWTDPKMAAHYTRTANRKRLAAESINKPNAGGTSIPSPSHPARAKGVKRQ